jgi:hypothetical protein
VGRREPAHQKLGANVIGQVGHHLDRRREMRQRVERQRVAFKHLEPPGIRPPRSRPARAGSARLSRPRAPCARLRPAARASARRGRARPRAHPRPTRSPAQRAILAVRLRSSRKFCPSALRAESSCARSPRAAGAASSIPLTWLRPLPMPSGRPARSGLQRGEAGVRHAFARDIKAVPWSGEVRMKGRPSVTFTPSSKAQRLDRDQRLVVIHADRRVIARPCRGVEHRVGGERPGQADPSARALQHGGDHLDLLAPHLAAFARMGVQPRHRDARILDAEIAL